MAYLGICRPGKFCKCTCSLNGLDSTKTVLSENCSCLQFKCKDHYYLFLLLCKIYFFPLYCCFINVNWAFIYLNLVDICLLPTQRDLVWPGEVSYENLTESTKQNCSKQRWKCSYFSNNLCYFSVMFVLKQCVCYFKVFLVTSQGFLILLVNYYTSNTQVLCPGSLIVGSKW